MLPGLGFSEIVLLAVIALLVVGPKDLPLLLRRIGQFSARMRGLAAEFRAGFDDLARAAELDQLKKEVDSLRNAQVLRDLGRSVTDLAAMPNLLGPEGQTPTDQTPSEVAVAPSSEVPDAEAAHAEGADAGGQAIELEGDPSSNRPDSLEHFQQNRSQDFVPENAQIQTFSASNPLRSGSDFAHDALAPAQATRPRGDIAHTALGGS